MKRILFICEGNVGRSQMAEGFYNFFKGEGGAISAGINNVGRKYNYSPRADIVEAMNETGIDISKQKIKQFTQNMLVDVSTIVVLCNKKFLPPTLANKNVDIIYKEIKDPFNSTPGSLREIRDQIKKIVLEIIEKRGS